MSKFVRDNSHIRHEEIMFLPRSTSNLSPLNETGAVVEFSSAPLAESLVMATSSAYARAVKVTAGYLQPLAGFSVNLSSSTSDCLRM